jgi:hypothetical protein
MSKQVKGAKQQRGAQQFTFSQTVKDRLMDIDCLFIAIEEMIDRDSLEEPDLEVLRAIAQRGRRLESEAMESLPNGGDL